MSSKKHLKDNNKTTHWVGYSKLKPLDKDFFKEKLINDQQDSLTGTTIEQSDSGRKTDPGLLQEAE